jgi:EAL domain-containing protein (putative c-di-GMP-specific phosphodiesterase class I)/ActR/RegA family two-component response regulator
VAGKMNIKSIYIIDDERDISELITQFASTYNIQTHTAISWANVSLKQLENTDLILLDLHLPELDGLDILELLQEKKITVPIVLCSGQDDHVVDTAADLLKSHGLNYAGKILKPFSYSDFSILLGVLNKLDLTKDVVVPDSSISATDLSALDKITLQEAISNNYFSVAFQPQFTSQNHQFCGIECLARLDIPGKKRIMPDTFISALLANDLIDDFTLNIVKHGLNVLNDLPLPNNIKIAFNLSTTSLTNEFINKLCDCCKPFRFSSSDMVWEITETATLDIRKTTKTLMTKLRLNGFNLSLDDFGTGYSTIQELDSMPFNEIKIDKAFVHSMHDKKASMAIVSATIQLANALDFRVVAEGVETLQQAQTLKRLNCEVSQGYFYSRPLDKMDFESFIHLYNKKPPAMRLV